MYRVSRALFTLALVFIATGTFVSPALAASGSFYIYDPGTGEARYDAPYTLADGDTAAVPFNVSGFIEIDIDLEPFLFPDGEVFLIDPDTGDRTLVGYANEMTWTQSGTYELDIYQYVVAPSLSPWQRLFSWFMPIAHAAPPSWEYLETIRFIITEGELPPPPCCSSVLFLPGIQGSVLKDGANTLWPATLFDVNDDLAELAFDEDGTAVNQNIVVAGILNEFPVGPFSLPVYQGFTDYMESLTEDNGNGTIHEWMPFAYDWRKPLQETVDEGVFWESEGEVIQLVETIENLAQDSKTGKVTIVAHSMGGLLGKALIKKLEDLGEADLIDNFIMVGSPQLGTGQAVGGLLHGEGSELAYGVIAFVNKAQARALGQNLESAYSLLPSRKYFDEITDPVLVFSTTTPPAQEWRDYAGECLPSLFCINDYAKMTDFLIGESLNREYPAPSDHKTPERLNVGLIQNAEEFHQTYDDYEIPSNIRVVQIAGWGLDTIKGITYTEDDAELDYEPRWTAEGDAVVVYPSAFASDGEQYYFNLFNYNETNPDVDHGTIMGSESVIVAVQSVLSGELVSQVDFFSTTRPPLADANKKLLISAHSPVTIAAHDSNGNYTGIAPGQDPNADILVITNDIPGSQYLTFGEGKYILLPEDGDYMFEFRGTGGGSATIKVEEIADDVATHVATYTDIPVTPQTVATFDISDAPITETPITVDENGVITTVTPDDYIPPSPSDPTIAELIATLKTKIQSLDIKPKLKTSLLKRVDKIEQKIEKQKERKSKVLEKLKVAIAKKAGKGTIDATSATEITTLIEELEASIAVFPLDPVLIQELRTKVQSLAIAPKAKTNLLKRVDRLEKMARLLLSLERLTTVILKKGTQGKISDADAQSLLDLLLEIEARL